MSKYDSIPQYLDRKGVDAVSLTFTEIERVLGGPLPPSARKHQAWWANESSGAHVNAKAWRRAGWKTRGLDLGAERVVFVRDRSSPRPSDSRSGAIRVPRRLLSPSALRVIEAEADPERKIAEALNEAFNSPRRALLRRISGLAPKVTSDSTDLIRQDRDGR